MWKVYRIDDGRIIKAGFESDDQAKDWLERRNDLADDEFDVEEMDEEEVAEFTESDEDDEAPAISRQSKLVVADDDEEDFPAADLGEIDYGDAETETVDDDDEKGDDDDDEEEEDDDDDDEDL